MGYNICLKNSLYTLWCDKFWSYSDMDQIYPHQSCMKDLVQSQIQHATFQMLRLNSKKLITVVYTHPIQGSIETGKKLIPNMNRLMPFIRWWFKYYFNIFFQFVNPIPEKFSMPVTVYVCVCYMLCARVLYANFCEWIDKFSSWIEHRLRITH